MKRLLLSIAALAVVAAPVFGEDQDKHKRSKNRNDNPPPATQKQVNSAPRSYTPRVQQQMRTNTQLQNKPTTTTRTFPRSYTPDVQAKIRTRKNVTPSDQNAPRTVTPNTTVTNNDWRNRNRNRDTNVVTNQTPNTNTTTVQSNTNRRNRNRNSNDRDWQNNRNRNWNNNTAGTFTFEQARRHHHRDRHDRSWWRSHFTRISLFAGGYYYWDSGYWYPAYGYDPYYSTYAYDEPIYGYDNLEPGQVIANVQAALQEQGYYNDAVDGLIGPNTRAALSNFQRDQGLPITAAIDGPTLQALGLA